METTTEAEKKTMRSYLLGDLSDEEKARLQERCLGDSEYFEELSAIEEEIIEAYVHSELEELDRERFEQYFMQSPGQRARVQRAAALLQALESARRHENAVASAASERGTVARPGSARRTFRFLLAAAALLIAGIVPWQVIQQNRLRAQLQKTEMTALEQQRQLEQRLGDQQKLASLQVEHLSERLRELESPQLNSLILDVYPSRFARQTDAVAANELTVHPEAKTITLLLHSTSRTTYPTYRLEIVAAAGSVRWQGEGLMRQPTGEYVLSVPTKLLPPGLYSLHVYAPNQSQPIESYRIQIATSPVVKDRTDRRRQ